MSPRNPSPIAAMVNVVEKYSQSDVRIACLPIQLLWYIATNNHELAIKKIKGDCVKCIITAASDFEFFLKHGDECRRLLMLLEVKIFFSIDHKQQLLRALTLHRHNAALSVLLFFLSDKDKCGEPIEMLLSYMYSEQSPQLLEQYALALASLCPEFVCYMKHQHNKSRGINTDKEEVGKISGCAGISNSMPYSMVSIISKSLHHFKLADKNYIEKLLMLILINGQPKIVLNKILVMDQERFNNKIAELRQDPQYDRSNINLTYCYSRFVSELKYEFPNNPVLQLLFALFLPTNNITKSDANIACQQSMLRRISHGIFRGVFEDASELTELVSYDDVSEYLARSSC